MNKLVSQWNVPLINRYKAYPQRSIILHFTLDYFEDVYCPIWKITPQLRCNLSLHSVNRLNLNTGPQSNRNIFSPTYLSTASIGRNDFVKPYHNMLKFFNWTTIFVVIDANPKQAYGGMGRFMVSSLYELDTKRQLNVVTVDSTSAIDWNLVLSNFTKVSRGSVPQTHRTIRLQWHVRWWLKTMYRGWSEILSPVGIFWFCFIPWTFHSDFMINLGF